MARETYVLAAVCLFDLLFTIWLVTTRRATEGNPVMSFYVDKGWTALVAAKATLVVLPLFILEWARRYHPDFVRRMTRVCIGVYLGLYVAAIAKSDLVDLGRGKAAAIPSMIQQASGMQKPVELVSAGDISRQ